MRFLGIEITTEKRSMADAGGVPAPDDDFWYRPVNSWNGANGEVAPEQALALGAVWNAVWIISSSLAQLPLHIYRKDGDKRERDPDYQNSEVILYKPNPNMTRLELVLLFTHQILLGGNAYGHVLRNNRNRILSVTPMRPDLMTVKSDKGVLTYHYREKGVERVFAKDQIFHLKGLSPDGITGYSPIALARITMSLCSTMEQHGLKLFEQGTMIAGVLEHPGKLKDEARDNLRKSWKARYAGVQNAGSVAVLEEGMKYNPLGMTNEDAQFILQRQYGVVDVARWFNIPPHMLKELSRATFSNIEEQNQNFLDFTLGPWLKIWETSLDDQLLLDGREFYVKFSADALLRGNSSARAGFYNQGVNGGWMSVNEARSLEDRDPVEGGDQHFRPLNLVPLDAEPQDPSNTQQGGSAPEPDGKPGRPPGSKADVLSLMADIRAELHPTMAENLGRAFRREAKMLQHAAKDRNPAHVATEFYAEFESFLVGSAEYVATAYAGLVYFSVRTTGKKVEISRQSIEKCAEIGVKTWVKDYISRAKARKTDWKYDEFAEFVQYLEQRAGAMGSAEVFAGIDRELWGVLRI